VSHATRTSFEDETSRTCLLDLLLPDQNLPGPCAICNLQCMALLLLCTLLLPCVLPLGQTDGRTDKRGTITTYTVHTIIKCTCTENQTNNNQGTHTHTQPFNDRWSGTTRVGRYQKKHSPTHSHPEHRTSLSSSSNYNDQWHPLCSFYVLDSPLKQPLSWSSLVILLVLDHQLHTPYISSPNHHLLFEAHAHTKAACSAAIPMLCHRYLVSLNSLLGSLSFRLSLTPHIHLTILISAC